MNFRCRQGHLFSLWANIGGKVAWRVQRTITGARVKEAGPSCAFRGCWSAERPRPSRFPVKRGLFYRSAGAVKSREYASRRPWDKRAAAGAATTLEQLMAKAKEDKDVAELPVLVKADVQGSAEAIVQALEKIGNDEVRVRVLHYGVGAITDTDVGLAEASGAPIIGFKRAGKCLCAEFGPTRRAWNCATTRSFMIWSTTSRLPHRAFCPPKCAKTSSAMPRSAKCSRSRALARWPAVLVTEGVARRSAACACCADKRGDPRRHAENPQALQGRGSKKCSRVRNAGWRLKITTISARKM